MKEKRCFNCESRYPGCHAECEYYLEWKKEHDRVKAEENAERKKEYDRKSYDVERHDRVIKATKYGWWSLAEMRLHSVRLTL